MRRIVLIVSLGLMSLSMQDRVSPWQENGRWSWARARALLLRANVWLRDAAKRHPPRHHRYEPSGFAPKDTMETTHLTRLYAYKGFARYSRTINIRRIGRRSRQNSSWSVPDRHGYVDGRTGGFLQLHLSPAYLLPKKVKPGKHLPGNRGG